MLLTNIITMFKLTTLIVDKLLTVHQKQILKGAFKNHTRETIFHERDIPHELRNLQLQVKQQNISARLSKIAPDIAELLICPPWIFQLFSKRNIFSSAISWFLNSIRLEVLYNTEQYCTYIFAAEVRI